MLRRLIPLAACLLLALPAAAQSAPMTVVATTTILADVAANVGGDLVDVSSLLPPDTDAHAYEPTAEDTARVAQADMLLTVGGGYEAFLGRLLENAGSGVNTVEVSRGLNMLPLGLTGRENADGDLATETAENEDAPPYLGVLGEGFECEPHEHDAADEAVAEHEHGNCDPHVWMNPQNVIGWVNNIVEAFSTADPANADIYRANGDNYIDQLEALDAEIEQILATVPEDRRVLVTNHEFMGYFADRYGFEVAATVLPGMNTGGEIDPQSLAQLITQVQNEQVPAIFAEVSANPQVAEVIASESGVAVVTALYSESLGEADSPASTYIDLMRYNALTIANALSPAE
jgi:ABC-type Zn uptake system ZnuABC Zn-binding protein ZnuA